MTLRYHGSNISGSQQWGALATTTAAATRTAKKQSVYTGKINAFFVPFLAVVASLRLSRARFMELVNTAQEFFFSFSKLRYGPFGFSPRQFCQDFKNKKTVNKIDEV